MELARLVSETNFWIFFFLTCVFGAGAAFLVGRTQAQLWRPLGATVVYMLLLGVAVRFCHYALFEREPHRALLLCRRHGSPPGGGNDWLPHATGRTDDHAVQLDVRKNRPPKLAREGIRRLTRGFQQC